MKSGPDADHGADTDTDTDGDDTDIDGVRVALLSWSDRSGRDLAWRRTRDPWAVLVSELMLQQTQVSRVEPKYAAFLERFATVQACAAAPVGDVVRLWAGLGYNRRAVNLHRCAAAVVHLHDGAIPADLPSLLALPGIGPYTARAVLAFAFEASVAVLDTNAARVLARLGGRTLRRAEAQARADELVPPGSGWAWNQAILDLGATVCVARSPRCAECPLHAWCGWRGDAEVPDPAVGSAGVTGRQSPFEGSDRQGRGRLVDRLRTAGRVTAVDLADAAGWPDDEARAQRAAASLVTDGLARWAGTDLVLP